MSRCSGENKTAGEKEKTDTEGSQPSGSNNDGSNGACEGIHDVGNASNDNPINTTNDGDGGSSGAGDQGSVSNTTAKPQNTPTTTTTTNNNNNNNSSSSNKNDGDNSRKGTHPLPLETHTQAKPAGETKNRVHLAANDPETGISLAAIELASGERLVGVRDEYLSVDGTWQHRFNGLEQMEHAPRCIWCNRRLNFVPPGMCVRCGGPN